MQTLFTQFHKQPFFGLSGPKIVLYHTAAMLTLVKIFPRSRRDLGEIAGEISARFWPPRFSSRRDLGRDRGRDRRVFGRRDFYLAAISAAKNALRLVARSRWDENLGGQKRAEISPNLGGQKRAEISGEISVRWKSRRPKTRRDLAKSRRPKTRRD